MKKIFYNCNIVTGKGIIYNGCFTVYNGKYQDIGINCDQFSEIESIDLQGQTVIPAFVDTHIHGFSHFAFEDPTFDYKDAEYKLIKNGTTTVLATISPYDIKGNKVEYRCKSYYNVINGIHLEGPFLNVLKKGGFCLEQIKEYSPDLFLNIINSYNGLVKIITIAPECVDIDQVIEQANRMNVKLSVGHTIADHKLAKRTFSLGVNRSTHTFNAMPDLNHKESSITDEILLNKDVYCEIIADLHHVTPELLKILIEVKGKEKVIGITDSVAITEHVTVKHHLAYVGDVIYGSQSTMYDIFINLTTKLGMKIEDAIYLTSINAANYLNLKTGDIEKNYDADFIVLREDNSIDCVYKNGIKF